MGCTTKQDAIDRKLRDARRREVDGVLVQTCPLCGDLYGKHTRSSCPPGTEAVLQRFEHLARVYSNP